MNPAFHLLLLSLLGSIVALIGGIIFLYNKRLSKALEANSVPFAAGVLLTVSLVGLLPEAVHAIGETAFTVVLITFLAVYVFEHLLCSIHHHDGHAHCTGNKGSVPFVIFGDTIHNFVDGIAIGAGFFVNPGFGLIAAISTFLHEVPHEIGDFGILLKAGWERKNIILVNVFSALTTIVGAFSVYLFAENEALIGILLAVSAGIFLYLGASDFLPHIEPKESKIKTITPLIIGVLAMMATFAFIPHAH